MLHLKEVRHNLGFSQRQLADLLGCSRAQLSMTESNKRPLPAASLQVLTLLQSGGAETKLLQGVEVFPVIAEIKMLAKMIRQKQVKLNGLQLQLEALEAKITKTLVLITSAGKLADWQGLPELVRLQATVIQRQASKKMRLYRQQRLKLLLAVAAMEAVLSKAIVLHAELRFP